MQITLSNDEIKIALLDYLRAKQKGADAERAIPKDAKVVFSAARDPEGVTATIKLSDNDEGAGSKA